MRPYVVFLIFVIVIVIIIALISDKIDNKNRNGKIEKDKISTAERDLVEKNTEIMKKYQRIFTQTIGY